MGHMTIICIRVIRRFLFSWCSKMSELYNVALLGQPQVYFHQHDVWDCLRILEQFLWYKVIRATCILAVFMLYKKWYKQYQTMIFLVGNLVFTLGLWCSRSCLESFLATTRNTTCRAVRSPPQGWAERSEPTCRRYEVWLSPTSSHKINHIEAIGLIYPLCQVDSKSKLQPRTFEKRSVSWWRSKTRAVGGSNPERVDSPWRKR